MALNAQEIINYIADSPKKTPVKIYVNLSAPVDFGSAEVFGEGKSRIVFGDWAELAPILEDNREKITDCVVENDRRNSGVPLVYHSKDKAEAKPVLDQLVRPGSTILVKASRGMELEELTAYLLSITPEAE